MANTSLEDLLALSPAGFEKLVGQLFSSMGYKVKQTKMSSDEGVDLWLMREEETSIVQCKRYAGTVGQPQIRDFYGTMQHAKARKGYFVTSGTFSLAASTWAEDKPLVLVNGPDLLAATANAGMALSTPKRTPGAPPDETPVAKAAKRARTSHRKLGRVLLDGPPPPRRTYEELAKYVAAMLGLNPHEPSLETVQKRNPTADPSSRGSSWYYLQGRRLRKRDDFIYASRFFSSASLLLVDEIDALSRAHLDVLVAGHRDGEIQVPSGYRDDAIKASFVLIATRWERRLPKIVVSDFSTIIASEDIEWESMPTAAELLRLEKQWRKNDAERRKHRQQQKRERRALKRKQAQEKLNTQREKLRAIAGLYCNVCEIWIPVEQQELRCTSCERELRYQEGVFDTIHKGVFGTRVDHAESADVERAKQHYLDALQ